MGAIEPARRIRPQAGPQETFLSSSADIAIYGGAAGGGKSWALLLEPLRHIANPDFGAVFFRRSTVQIRNEGGLWDESVKLYPGAGGQPVQHELYWKFVRPGSNSGDGASISFAHLEHETTVLHWHGAQIALLCFDELTHFSDKQFFYMLSRNRSTSGVRPYVRASCNPDPDSWVAGFISWWIDEKTGYPIAERSGVLRWFVRVGDHIVWANRPEELAEYTNPVDGTPIPPKSVTFIAAKLSDNQALMSADPGYVANLMALSTVERERLMGGNWKIRRSGGFYKREWFEVVGATPAGARRIRSWDLAGTEKKQGNNPDWTAGLKLAYAPDGVFYIEHVHRFRESPAVNERNIHTRATQDGRACKVSVPQDPAQAGKWQAETLIKKLAGFDVIKIPPTGDKEVRARPAAAQAEVGNIKIVASGNAEQDAWIEPLLTELAAFSPTCANDDQVDALSDALNTLALEPPPPKATVTSLRM